MDPASRKPGMAPPCTLGCNKLFHPCVRLDLDSKKRPSEASSTAQTTGPRTGQPERAETGEYASLLTRSAHEAPKGPE
jgi:hypothetical protein